MIVVNLYNILIHSNTVFLNPVARFWCQNFFLGLHKHN